MRDALSGGLRCASPVNLWIYSDDYNSAFKAAKLLLRKFSSLLADPSLEDVENRENVCSIFREEIIERENLALLSFLLKPYKNLIVRLYVAAGNGISVEGGIPFSLMRRLHCSFISLYVHADSFYINKLSFSGLTKVGYRFDDSNFHFGESPDYSRPVDALDLAMLVLDSVKPDESLIKDHLCSTLLHSDFFHKEIRARCLPT